MEGKMQSLRKSDDADSLELKLEMGSTPDEFDAIGITAYEVLGSTDVDGRPEAFHEGGLAWHSKAPNPTDPEGPWLLARTRIYLRPEAVADALAIILAEAGLDNPLYTVLKIEQHDVIDDPDHDLISRRGEHFVITGGEAARRAREALRSLFDRHTPRTA